MGEVITVILVFSPRNLYFSKSQVTVANLCLLLLHIWKSQGRWFGIGSQDCGGGAWCVLGADLALLWLPISLSSNTSIGIYSNPHWIVQTLILGLSGCFWSRRVLLDGAAICFAHRNQWQCTVLSLVSVSVNEGGSLIAASNSECICMECESPGFWNQGVKLIQ